MSTRRVFLSHSSPVRTVGDELELLQDALQQAGFGVLLDQDGLQLGAGWRHTLNMWMGGCHAAVMLLSESALQSPFVAYEAAILSYRAHFDKNFHLLPLLLAPVNRARVENSRLNPAVLSELQWVGESVAPAQAISAIVQRLAAVVPSATSLDRVAKHISWLLEQAPDYVVDEQITQLGLDVSAWVPGEERRLRLAYALLGAGLKRGQEALNVLKGYVRDSNTEHQRELLDLVGSSWVDCTALERIQSALRSSEPLALSGGKSQTARMYLVRACKRRPKELWKYVSIDGIIGENGLSAVVGQIKEALCNRLQSTPQDLKNDLDFYVANDEPIFVVLPPDVVLPGDLGTLRNEFPGVTFFLLTGHPPPVLQVLQAAKIQYLDPDVEPSTEKHHVDEYSAKLRLWFGKHAT